MELLERVQWLELHHVLRRDARRQAQQTYRLARLLGCGSNYSDARLAVGLSEAEACRAIASISSAAEALGLSAD